MVKVQLHSTGAASRLAALGYSFQGSNTTGILPRRALPGPDAALPAMGLGATLALHHALPRTRMRGAWRRYSLTGIKGGCVVRAPGRDGPWRASCTTFRCLASACRDR